MLHPVRRTERETGSAMLEFCLCCLVIMPLVLGLCGGGVLLIRQIELTQVCRDAGHMYAKGVDFSERGNQALIGRMSGSLNFGTTQPAGGLILSRVTYVTKTVCAAAAAPRCGNEGHFVITAQARIGEPAISAVGVFVTDYLNDSRARVKVFPSPIEELWKGQLKVNPKQNQQFAYVSEASVRMDDLAWTGVVSPWASAWSVF